LPHRAKSARRRPAPAHCRIHRGPDNKFHFDGKRSSATKAEIEALYFLRDDGDPAAFLRSNFANLKRIAAGTRTLARKWLAQDIKQFPDSAKRRELRRLLAAKSP